MLCAFITGQPAPNDIYAYSFGYVSGDDNDGLYGLYAYGYKGGVVNRPEEGQRPSWIYHIDALSWTFTSVDNIQQKIVFAKQLVPGATRADLPASYHDQNFRAGLTGVCEIGGPAS